MTEPPNPPSTKTAHTSQSHQTRLANSYYGLLGVNADASAIQIRQAYRELSKRYHPDTTELSQEEAKTKFQKLNEAYGTLSNPERRASYNLQIGYYGPNYLQTLPQLKNTKTEQKSQPGYLEPIDRPLSAGEIFVLFMLGVTFILCVLLVIAVAVFRGDPLFGLPTPTSSIRIEEVRFHSKSPEFYLNPPKTLTSNEFTPRKYPFI